MRCGVCKKEINGEPYTLSDLTEEGNLLSVCETCAGSQYIDVVVGNITVSAHRDDYIACNKERFEDSVYEAVNDLSKARRFDRAF